MSVSDPQQGDAEVSETDLVRAVREKDATIARLREALRSLAPECPRCFRLATRFCRDCGSFADSRGCDNAEHGVCLSCGHEMTEAVPYVEQIREVDRT